MTINYWKLGPDGEPVACADVREWAEWFEDLSRISVRRTLVENGEHTFFVSTIFLGMSVCGPDGAPPDWEVATFPAEEQWPPQLYRCESREEADALHRSEVERLCAEWQATAREFEWPEQGEFLKRRRLGRLDGG